MNASPQRTCNAAFAVGGRSTNARATVYPRVGSPGAVWETGPEIQLEDNAKAGDPQRYVTLARFFAENISVQATSLEKTVVDGADAVNGADAVLLA